MVFSYICEEFPFTEFLLGLVTFNITLSTRNQEIIKKKILFDTYILCIGDKKCSTRQKNKTELSQRRRLEIRDKLSRDKSALFRRWLFFNSRRANDLGLGLRKTRVWRYRLRELMKVCSVYRLQKDRRGVTGFSVTQLGEILLISK